MPIHSTGYRTWEGRRVPGATRWVTIAVVLAGFGASIWGFGFIEQSFFPPSTRPQLMVDFWLPQGTHIDETQARVEEVEAYIRELDGVTQYSAIPRSDSRSSAIARRRPDKSVLRQLLQDDGPGQQRPVCP